MSLPPRVQAEVQRILDAVARRLLEEELPPAWPEPWLSKTALAKHLSCSVRWVEQRMEEGMPHAHIAGRAKFRVSEVEPWLEQHGHLSRRGSDTRQQQSLAPPSKTTPRKAWKGHRP